VTDGGVILAYLALVWMMLLVSALTNKPLVALVGFFVGILLILFCDEICKAIRRRP
jgi:hypothetical protein